MFIRVTVFAFLAVAAALTAGCETSSNPPQAPGEMRLYSRSGSSASPIQHVVLMIQENRSFNDFFATYPGADGTTTGQAQSDPSCSPSIDGGSIALTEMPLDLSQDMNHTWKTGYSIAYDGGKMDAFDEVKFGNGEDECSYPYQYTNPAQIQPYWTLASEYTLAEHLFTTQGSGSFIAHQDLIRGGTIVEPNKAMVDDPTTGDTWWGCNASPGTITHLITKANVFIQKGPFPCSNKFRDAYPTLRDLLDAKKVSWKYYVPPSSQIDGRLWSAFDLVYPVRYGPEWKANISTPETNILSDVTSGKLAAMSWVIPEGANSDHPDTELNGKYVDNGPEWIATVVNAIGESSYWDSTAIIIVWDDWGGFYDNAGGALGKYAGPGERVPAIIVSPYARAGYISTTTYQFGSILKYIEQNWKLGSLNTTDKSSKSIIDCFNYGQSPIQFQPISSSLGKSYFMHEKHSYRPPDTDW
ncbi:MAG: alkaline phosphatase family protein [Candidatus Cybelea sp.]